MSSGKRRQKPEAPLEVELVFVDIDKDQTRLQRAMKILLQSGDRFEEQEPLRDTVEDDHE